MLLTFLLIMISSTLIFLTFAAVVTHQASKQHAHILAYIISVAWQGVCLLTAYPSSVIETPAKIIGNFTTYEIVVALIGLIIGIITCFVAYHDFGYAKHNEKNTLL